MYNKKLKREDYEINSCFGTRKAETGSGKLE
jgi:hypothetical protein